MARLTKNTVDRHFKNKTIANVDTSSCNCWIFHFTDKTSVMIEVEAVRNKLYGIVVVDELKNNP